MIVPNGKRRNQVNQGGMKHESIWDSSFFSGVAGDLTKQALAPVSPPGEKVDETPEQKAMDGSNSSRLNPSKIPSAGEMKGKPNPQGPPPEGGPEMAETSADNPTQRFEIGTPDVQTMQDGKVPADARFDPYTGEPLMGVDGTKLSVLMKKWLASQNETSDLDITGWNQKGQQYNITLSPRNNKVTKPSGGGV